MKLSLGIGVTTLCLLLVLPPSRKTLFTALSPVLKASFGVIGSRISFHLRGSIEESNSVRMGHALPTPPNLSQIDTNRTSALCSAPQEWRLHFSSVYIPA